LATSYDTDSTPTENEHEHEKERGNGNGNGNWRNRIVRNTEVEPRSLIENPLNFRVHSSFQSDALKSVLNKVGWVQSIIVSYNTGRVLDGHLRLKEAIENLEDTVPVTYVDITEAEERLILATFDQITGLATYDQDTIDELFSVAAQDQQDLLNELLVKSHPYNNAKDKDEDDDESGALSMLLTHLIDGGSGKYGVGGLRDRLNGAPMMQGAMPFVDVDGEYDGDEDGLGFGLPGSGSGLEPGQVAYSGDGDGDGDGAGEAGKNFSPGFGHPLGELTATSNVQGSGSVYAGDGEWVKVNGNGPNHVSGILDLGKRSPTDQDDEDEEEEDVPLGELPKRGFVPRRKGSMPKPRPAIIIMCRDEAHQQEIFSRLETEGLEVKMVVT